MKNTSPSRFESNRAPSRSRRRSRVLGALLVASLAALGTSERALAACPQNLCDCLGAAKDFNLVSSKLMTVQEARQLYYSYSYFIETYVEGDVCAPRLLASGPAGYPTYVDDALALQPKGTAVRIAVRDPEHSGDYGVAAYRVATGGGAIAGLSFLSAYEIDTTGTNPRLPECQQAIADMQSASATLAALPPTQNLGVVDLRGDYLDIETGPGVQVLDAAKIIVRPRSYYGYPQPASLFIENSESDMVVINTRSLRVGELCQIDATDATKIVINVVGDGPTVKVGKFGLVYVPILAPQRSVTIGLQLGDFAVSSVMGQLVRLKGSTAFDGLRTCSEEP